MADTKEAHALAEKLYEASNTTGIPWNRRGRLIHDAWLVAATRQLAFPGGSHELPISAKTDTPAQPSHDLVASVAFPTGAGTKP
ncbi:hypothetical protein [Nitrospirillum viridazoti]|uniref:Uncharacterized protein n=1 Tax=Nitrospirillum viridazoti CBAmc TaxID=1441467 RepID=A0A248JNK9_9PROT|nr:hypothetical protein [Nitrospirillum amazonense]ASG20297.1 hypothetical protein Y958_05295 [Nitrospirillum amazonense CBAmc]TWB34670.1 hypothetical protein FBZ91_1112 [Nitrospirillum amazonense]